VFTIAVGSSSRLPDVELLGLDAGHSASPEKSVRVPFTIDEHLPRERVATVTLKTSTATSSRAKSASPRWAVPAIGSSEAQTVGNYRSR